MEKKKEKKKMETDAHAIPGFELMPLWPLKASLCTLKIAQEYLGGGKLMLWHHSKCFSR